EGTQVVELWVVHPDHVKVTKRGAGRVYEVWRGGQKAGEFTQDEVLHIRGFSMPGSLYGLSPIEYHRSAIGLSLAAEEYGARFFGHDATPGGVIEVPAGTSESALKQMAAKWRAKHQGLSNAHEPGFLLNGSKWQAVSIPNDSAQFLETRKMQVTEIARLFGVPAHKVGDMEHATFSNIEHQAIEFVQDCILPWLKCLEEAFNPLLGRGAAPDMRTGAYVKWNVDGLLRGDSQSRAEFYNVMRNIGVYNADDILALEDRPPIPGGAGQMYWRPLNMGDAADPMPLPDAPPAVPTAPATNGNGQPDPEATRVARLLAAGRQ
ncbi:MAG TPA: phage portal protein, partial [Acidimicrobiales bacterium]|nr:phage portal protein [Acidimicrobiales bacterium]